MVDMRLLEKPEQELEGLSFHHACLLDGSTNSRNESRTEERLIRTVCQSVYLSLEEAIDS